MRNIIKILIANFTLVCCIHNKSVHNIWIGNWERVGWQNEASLKIDDVTKDSFSFSVFASSGGHNGDISGKAIIKDSIATYYFEDKYDKCKLKFILLSDSAVDIIQEIGLCSAPMGVIYSGRYYSTDYKRKLKNEEIDLISLGVLSVTEDAKFRNLVGDSYSLFVSTTQLSYNQDDIDSLNFRVITAGVRGMFTYMENIIMIDSANRFCAAVIKDDKVLYFSNIDTFKNVLPKTIEKWRDNFKEYEVIFK
jgi:hypothetical protein